MDFLYSCMNFYKPNMCYINCLFYTSEPELSRIKDTYIRALWLHNMSLYTLGKSDFSLNKKKNAKN